MDCAQALMPPCSISLCACLRIIYVYVALAIVADDVLTDGLRVITSWNARGLSACTGAGLLRCATCQTIDADIHYGTHFQINLRPKLPKQINTLSANEPHGITCRPSIRASLCESSFVW